MNNKMKGIPITVATIVISLTLLHGLAFGSNLPPVKGDMLPDIKIPVPVNTTDSSYLGLKSIGFFKIPQIKARAVIIEIFSMYCPHCQREAPEINRLYSIIEQEIHPLRLRYSKRNIIFPSLFFQMRIFPSISALGK